MPTLDDAPTIPKLTGVLLTNTNNPTETADTIDEADLIQVYDVSTQKVKTITIAALGTTLGIAMS